MGIDKLDLELFKILENYSEELNKKNIEVIKKTSKDALKKLVDISPERKGDYKKSFKLKIINKEEPRAIIYSPKHYRIIHLLEFGHNVVIKTKNGLIFKNKKTKKIPHISIVQEELNKKYIEALKERIKE